MALSPDYYKNQYESAIKLAARHAKECMRLRAALEKYAKRENWLQAYDTFCYSSVPNGYKFDDMDIIDIENHPWEIAKEALSG